MSLYITTESEKSESVLIVTTKEYVIRDTENKDWSKTINGKTLIAHLKNDHSKKKPFRYVNATSNRTFKPYVCRKYINNLIEISNTGEIVRIEGVDSPSIKVIPHESNRLLFIRFFNSFNITIDCASPSLQQDNIAVMSFKFGNVKETFSYNSSSDGLHFTFRNIRTEDDTLCFDFHVLYMVDDFEIKGTLVASVEINKDYIYYKDSEMPHLTEAEITKELTIGRDRQGGILF